ncbi:hypothetical protein Tco_0689449 [Tanacetum coccineum]
MVYENPIRTLGDYSKPCHEGYRNAIELPIGNKMVPLRSDTNRRTIDQSAGGKLRDQNTEESWALLEDLTLYDNESWNDPRDFAKRVKVIALPQDVPSTSDRHLIEVKNQVQRLMEAHLALTQPTQVNKITTSCEICGGPHDTQYCTEYPEQAFVEYASLRTDEAGGNRYYEKDKNKAKIDKTEYVIGMSMKNQSQRRVHLKWEKINGQDSKTWAALPIHLTKEAKDEDPRPLQRLGEHSQSNSSINSALKAVLELSTYLAFSSLY